MEDWVAAERALRDYHARLKEAREFYSKTKEVKCPYFGFGKNIPLNSDGFNHLINKPNRDPRPVNERLLKLRLLKKAIHTLSVAGTVQEYRSTIQKVGKPAKDGFSKTTQVQYWAFHDIVGTTNMFLIRTIVRQVGTGIPHFWSVMPIGKIEKQKLYRGDIETA